MLSERARVRPSAVFGTAAMCLALSGGNTPATAQTPMGTAFTYQGELTSGGVPVDEPLVGCDFEFTLWDADIDGSQVGPMLTPTALVGNGRFTVALDFGADNFTGDARWLEISVCCPSSCVDFTTLSPRQELTPTLYSLHTLSAESAPWSGLTGVPAGFADDVDDDALGALSCADGEIAKWDGVAWVCGEDIDTDTDTDTLGALSCADAEIAKWNNGTAQWECTMDDTGTGNTLDEAYDQGGLGAGRTITADAGAVHITGPDGLMVSGTIQSGNSIIIDGVADTITSNGDLEFHVNDGRVLRLETNATSPNLIGGFSGNSIAAGKVGATIAGGGMAGFPNSTAADFTTVSGGLDNTASGDVSTVSGGLGNDASGFRATVAGGQYNTADSSYSTVSGGTENIASNVQSTVGGGVTNAASGESATVGGGSTNTASGHYATVGGGWTNTASLNSSTVAGGQDNTTNASYATVGGGLGNLSSTAYSTVAGGSSNTASGSGSFVGGGNFNTASGGSSVVAGGWGNFAIGEYATVAGGQGHSNSGQHSTIAGGQSNTVNGQHSAIAGGLLNTANGGWSTVGGGKDNFSTGDHSVVAGGRLNTAGGSYATIGGGQSNESSGIRATISGGFTNTASGTRSTVGGGVNNTASAIDSTVGGGFSNTASGVLSTVGGGETNTASGSRSTVGGGRGNVVSAKYGTIAGGGPSLESDITTANFVFDRYGSVGGGADNRAGSDDGNPLNGEYATVAGGRRNTANGYANAIGGGYTNTSSDVYSTIGGGGFNIASADQATVGGGQTNVASGIQSTIPGGSLNTANGRLSFAAGQRAKANHEGSFVWADSNGPDFTSSAADQFSIKASGGTRIFSNSVATVGVQLVAGGNSWSAMSDRAVKENFTRLDPAEVLEKLARIPVTRWNLKSQDPSIQHIGPMAQDFHAAFGVGESDRYISSSDADGVALAAIQGLYEMVKDQQERIASLEKKLSELGAKVGE